MANVLQFALGLSATNFLSTAGASKLALGALTAAGAGLGAVMAGVFQQIQRGGDLADLSNRTGESVENLVKLQRGFEITGVSAESVTGIIGSLQRSLGGFNEMGEPTKDIFSGIGLSVEKLKEQNAPEAILGIFGALNKLNRNDAANAAGKIFGRGNGANILQAARDGDSFADAMKRAANEAAIFQRSAAAMDKLGDAVQIAKVKISEVFAGLAEQVTNAALVAQQAFGDGQLASLISLGLQAAFEKGTSYLSALLGNPTFWSGMIDAGLGAFAALGGGLLKIMQAPLAFIQAAYDALIQSNMEQVGKIPGVGKALGLSDFKSQGFDELLAERQRDGVSLYGSSPDEIFKTAVESIKAGLPQLGDAFSAAAAASGGPLQTAFSQLFAELQAKVKTDPSSRPGSEAITSAASGGGAGGKSGTVDALARIGFFSRGHGGDSQQETAKNTAGMHLVLKQTHQLLKERLGGGAENSFGNV